ncbi:arabinogalactan protein 20 [Zostera marina]|uniref:Arabinogalactan protein 20 n=1 Tax=Zostera marina TaxID=29655 RepID=A0A0K9NUB9_ZOSMR|nr:arabinogalactan protein 20 [Zostera marina]
MANSRASNKTLKTAALVLIIGIILPLTVHGQESPAPAPVSDGTSVDQGIAYGLMLVALVLTYLIHPLDASSLYGLF